MSAGRLYDRIEDTFLLDDGIVAIREISEVDREIYYNMAKARSFLKNSYEKLFEHIWLEIMNRMVIAFAVVELESGEICGFSKLDMQNENCPEFGIDIIDAYMGKGYGYRASALVRKYASDWENVEYFTWKADSDNEKSRRIAEKLGGVLIQQRHFLPDKVIEFGLEQGILEEEDLSIVCKYKIEKV